MATVSGFFLMDRPHASGGPRTVVFADCGVVPDPTADQLADIAMASALSAEALLGELSARVALLKSFSTKGSAAHPHVDKVLAALKLAGERRPDLAIDGELQADGGAGRGGRRRQGAGQRGGRRGQRPGVPRPGRRGTSPTSSWRASVARSPSGPCCRVWALPMNDLSRGATVDEIVDLACVTAVQATARASGYVTGSAVGAGVGSVAGVGVGSVDAPGSGAPVAGRSGSGMSGSGSGATAGRSVSKVWG